MQHLYLSLYILFLSTVTFAHEEARPLSREYRLLQSLPTGNGKAYLVAREDGHLVGQPFQVELRLNCEGDDKKIMDLPVHDSFSVCDMKPESIKINKSQTAVAMKTKMADLNAYYTQVEEGNPRPEVRCQEETTIKKFSLRNLCP